MKSKFLLLVSLVLTINVFAQTNPCPDIQSLNVISVTASPCAAFVSLVATGDVGSTKGLQVIVYEGNGTAGTILSTNCFQVPPGSSDTYQTNTFSCTREVTIVITQFTASNGNCQGGSCSITRRISGTPGVVLPVSITSFSANRNGGIVLLKWTSESEKDFKSYQIEMNDGTGFKTVGTVQANNTGNSSSYNFEQSLATKQSVQYRLKLIDLEGRFSFSKTALVKGDSQAFDFNIFPNPSTSANTNILISGLSNSGRIQIIDMTGKVLKTLVVNSNNVKAGDLPTGVYMVKVTNTATAEQITKRMVIVN